MTWGVLGYPGNIEGWLAPSMVHVCIMYDVDFLNVCTILIYHKCDNNFFFLTRLFFIQLLYLNDYNRNEP